RFSRRPAAGLQSSTYSSRDYIALYDQLLVQWRDPRLREFVSELVATYLVGPAFGWQHVRLCSGRRQMAYQPALGQSAEHPADEARLGAILAVLNRLGAAAAGQRILALWRAYLATTGQARPAEYDVCYPQHLIEALADQVVRGCRARGVRGYL